MQTYILEKPGRFALTDTAAPGTPGPGEVLVMEQSPHLLQQGGKLIFVGLINDHVSLFDPDIHRREAAILSSRNSVPAEHHRVLEAMESGQIDVSEWPTEFASPAVMPQRFPA